MTIATPASLTPAQRGTLLQLARTAIRDRLRPEDGSLQRLLDGVGTAGALAERRGAFVTLHEQPPGGGDGRGRLRGCIGTVEAERPLFRNVIDGAVHAALDDPRFPALAWVELERVAIEISVLSPLWLAAGAEEIVPGRDGVMLESGDARAVFLPHVATEHGWDRRELLAQLALKAGLPRTAWKSARLLRFGAEVFDEREHRC